MDSRGDQVTAVTVAEMRRVVAGVVQPLPTRRLAAADCLGSVLAAPLIALDDFPDADRSAMDGFAFAGAGPWLLRTGGINAGSDPGQPLDSGEADAHGAQIVVDGVVCRPGGTQLTALLPDGRVVLGLPGNPLAAVAVIATTGGAIAAAMTGHTPTVARGELATPLSTQSPTRICPAWQCPDGTWAVDLHARTPHLATLVGRPALALVDTGSRWAELIPTPKVLQCTCCCCEHDTNAGHRGLTALSARPAHRGDLAQARLFDDILQNEIAELQEVSDTIIKGLGVHGRDQRHREELPGFCARINEMRRLLDALRQRFPNA